MYPVATLLLPAMLGALEQQQHVQPGRSTLTQHSRINGGSGICATRTSQPHPAIILTLKVLLVNVVIDRTARLY